MALFVVWFAEAWAWAGDFGPVANWYDLPPGDAAVTLKLFVTQSEAQVIFLVDKVRGVRTQRVAGRMTPDEALSRMLEGTELRAIQDEKTGAWIVNRAAPGQSRNRIEPASRTGDTGSNRPLPKPRAPDTATIPETIVKLPAFSITSEKDVSYVGHQALSTTRTGVDLADLPQSVIVLNQSFLNDVNPTILAKALNYVGGAQTGTISWSVDRYIIRGFVGEGDYVDGFRTQTDKNTDLNLIDHVEIIKGPSAIFIGNQANTVGGVINKISKSPTDYPVASLTLQAGRWDANRGDLDIGGPITVDKRWMYRLLLAAQESEGYYDATYEKRRSIVPMLAYRFDDDTEMWVKFEAFTSRYSSYNGLPLDGRTNEVVAVPWTRNFSEDRPLNWRTDRFWRAWAQFTSRLNDHLAIRLAAFDSEDRQKRVESILVPHGGTISNGTLDPQYVVPASYVAGTPLPRATTAVYPDDQPRREVQADAVINFRAACADHKLLLGGNFISYPQDMRTFSSGPFSTARSGPIDPFDPAGGGRVSVDFNQPPANWTHKSQSFAKIYALETASLLQNRIIASFGGSWNRFAFSQRSVSYNQRTGERLPEAVVPKQHLNKNLLQYGLLVKPLPNVSVFYGYNKNFSSNGLSATNQLLPPQEGEQNEWGIKTQWWGGKVNVSVNYFDVVQRNNSVPAYPQTTPPSSALVSGTISRGVDGDFSASLTKNIDLLGSFAFFQARVPLPAPWDQVVHPHDGRRHRDLPVNNVSERNFSLWTRYKFTDSALRGLAVGLGFSYLAPRAITDNNNQVLYGFLPSRTLLDASISYEHDRFKYQLNVDNLLDADYMFAARSNQILVPGTPLNVRAAVTVRF